MRLPLMPDLTENFFANPTGAMVTDQVLALACRRQGACCWATPRMPSFRSSGRESIAASKTAPSLLELLDRHGTDWERVFREFETARKANTDAIADLAIENFVEMRDRVADPRFLFRKKVELALEKKYPGLFVPKYAMVTFHRIPYSAALRRGQLQDRMLGELCDPIERVEDLTGVKRTV